MDGAGDLLQARSIAGGARLDAVGRLASSARTDAPAEAARKFEALFATLLVKEMRGSLSEGFFGSGPQSDVYAGWLDQFLGEALARDGGLHLADGVRRSLERKQAAERAAGEQLGAACAGGAPAAGADTEHGAPSAGPAHGARAPHATADGERSQGTSAAPDAAREERS